VIAIFLSGSQLETEVETAPSHLLVSVLTAVLVFSSILREGKYEALRVFSSSGRGIRWL